MNKVNLTIINDEKGGLYMAKQFNDKRSHYTPNHIGTQPRGFGGNKGKKMQDQSGDKPDVIQTKGE